MIKPLFDRVLLKPIQAEQNSALFVPQDEDNNIGIVVAVGQTKEISVGDSVVYNKYAATTINHQNTQYIIIKEVDILAII